MTALYVYGLTSQVVSPPDGLAAVDAPGATIECVDFGHAFALVSPIVATRLDPLRRHMLAHTRVLECALAAGCLLPARFGMIVASRERLAALIQHHAPTVAAQLRRVNGFVEAGVKASWARDSVWRRVGAADPSIVADCARLAKADPNRAYFDRIDAGRRVSTALAALRAADADRLDALIARFAAAIKPLPGADDMMFAHRAALVSRAAEPALYASLREFASDGVDVRYVAPVPPYNFVDLALSGDELGMEAA